MTDAGFFRGTSSEQDNRFSDKEKKLMKQMKFADSILKKVDMSKVNLGVLKPWIANRISELLGMEDDVLNEFVFNQLEADNNPDGRRIQINLTGFLNGKNARVFTGELWDMLLDAMEHSGVPTALLNAKKAEISQRLIQAEEEKPKKLESTVRNSDDDRKSYHSRHHYDNDRDRDRYSHQPSKTDDSFGRDRRRYDDDSGDRHRSHTIKKSRFSDIQPDHDEFKSSHDSGRDSNRVKEPIREDELKKPERIDVDDDDGARVEMKKRKKNKHRHHRKRRSSSSSGNSEDDDEEEERGRQKHRRSSNSDKRKKKKSKKSRHSRSSDHSEERSLEQELRDRALESMRKQKTMDK
ncbi:unnamed protein product [Allacma fusca]|uniref:PWI domain-containing protein n=1 Tax=Allacma fusca TaxID=39272 RepID=A0A8J2K5E5_9HEXA|nr:unnamed protein product [Allacma fusca]